MHGIGVLTTGDSGDGNMNIVVSLIFVAVAITVIGYLIGTALAVIMDWLL